MLSRIISIGDLHGDYGAFVGILTMCNLINRKNEWIGGNTHVVQVGDTMDGKRPDIIPDPTFKVSPEEIKLTNFILKLDKEARSKHGRVVSVLGNHEMYPYYFRDDSAFTRDYVKKSDGEEYLSRYKMPRWKYFMPGKAGAILLGQSRPLFYKYGEFLFMHGSLTDSFIKDTEKNGKIDINKVNNDVSMWLQGIDKKPPSYLNEMNPNINPLLTGIFRSLKLFRSTIARKIKKPTRAFRWCQVCSNGTFELPRDKHCMQ